MSHTTDKVKSGKVRGFVSHKQRHVDLHKALDELFADYITNANGDTSHTIMDLISWSYDQTIEPNHSYE